jgi:NADH:ubiquinone oxidoreductase subunit 4 (subunit M)
MYAAFTKSIVGGLVLLTTVIVVGGYSLLLSNRILFGDLNKVTLELLEDINRREIIICLVLAFFVILLGVQPRIVSDLFNDDLSPILAFLYQF